MVALDEEQDCIRQIQNGDPQAFEPLVRRYQRMVHSLAYRMCGSATEAEDLAQEIFIHVYRQIGNFRGESKFSSWLYRIAVNLSLNWVKHDRRRERACREWGNEWEIVTEREGDGAAALARAQQVQAALQKLPPKQRAAIVLTVYQGLSHAEAARALGCSETTVSWRLFAARAKLKKQLKHYLPRP